MKRYVLALLLLALPLGAQEEKKAAAPEPVPKRVQRLFMLKYADPQSMRNLLSVFGGNIVPNPEMHALAVEGTESSVAAIEDVIKRLDVPSSAPRNIDLTVYFLVGTEGDSPYGGPVPKDLDSVVAALKGSFPFKDYRLMDTLLIRTRTGQQVNLSSNAGSVRDEGHGSQQIAISFHIDSSSISPDGASVRLDRMRTGARVPYYNSGWGYTELSINEDMDIKEGQKAVVGRVGINREQALFLVLSAKIVP